MEKTFTQDQESNTFLLQKTGFYSVTNTNMGHQVVLDNRSTFCKSAQVLVKKSALLGIQGARKGS